MMKFFLLFIASIWSFCFSTLNACDTNFDAEKDILIVGGGPAGLVLANSCERNALSYLLVEKNYSPSSYSKATGIHVNSMKFLYELGLSNLILEQAVKLDKQVIYHNGEIIKTVNFQHGQLEHEINLSLSQQKLERLLSQTLNINNVWYGHQFVDFSQHNQNNNFFINTVVDLQTNTVKLIRSRFIVAADGGKSSIRKKLSLPFLGETIPEKSFSFDGLIENKEALDPNSMYMFSRIISNQYKRLVVVPIDEGKQ